jgi:hypothetical protein
MLAWVIKVVKNNYYVNHSQIFMLLQYAIGNEYNTNIIGKTLTNRYRHFFVSTYFSSLQFGKV